MKTECLAFPIEEPVAPWPPPNPPYTQENYNRHKRAFIFALDYEREMIADLIRRLPWPPTADEIILAIQERKGKL